MRVEFRHAFHEENVTFELCVQLCEGLRLESRPVASVGWRRFHARVTNLDAPSRDLQNMEDRHADQSAKKRPTPYRIHASPLLNRRARTELTWKKYVYM